MRRKIRRKGSVKGKICANREQIEAKWVRREPILAFFMRGENI